MPAAVGTDDVALQYTALAASCATLLRMTISAGFIGCANGFTFNWIGIAVSSFTVDALGLALIIGAIRETLLFGLSRIGKPCLNHFIKAFFAI